jgi:hypothetical protein
MFHLLFDDRPWFAPKRFGLGSGLPIAWQGWLFLALHIALIIGVILLMIDRPVWGAIAVVLAAMLPMPIYAAKTKGGWRWRWGDKGDEK